MKRTHVLYAAVVLAALLLTSCGVPGNWNDTNALLLDCVLNAYYTGSC